jgi:hypothetical protein
LCWNLKNRQRFGKSVKSAKQRLSIKNIVVQNNFESDSNVKSTYKYQRLERWSLARTIIFNASGSEAYRKKWRKILGLSVDSNMDVKVSKIKNAVQKWLLRNWKFDENVEEVLQIWIGRQTKQNKTKFKELISINHLNSFTFIFSFDSTKRKEIIKWHFKETSKTSDCETTTTWTKQQYVQGLFFLLIWVLSIIFPQQELNYP